MPNAKIENLQALRGVAVLLVLFSHVSDMANRYGLHGGVLPNFENEASGGIYLFFVISGFIMATITRDLHQVPGACRAFLYRRVARIYPLYWLISLVILVVWLLRPGWVNSSTGGEVDVISSFLLLPQEGLPLLGQGWSLVHELYFYLVAGLSLFLPRRFLPLVLGLWATVVLLVIFLLPYLPVTGPSFCRVVFSVLTLQFIAGAVSALCVAKTGLWLGTLCFVGGSASLGVFLAAPPYEGPLPTEVMVRTLPVLAMVHGAVAMERAGRVLLPGFLRSIGDVSYSIYLTHILAISAIGRPWRALNLSAPWSNWVLIALLIVAPIVAGFACYHLLERPLLRFSRRPVVRGAGDEEPMGVASSS